MAQASMQPVIEVLNLKKYFHVNGKGTLHAVDDVSFSVMPGETVGLVGESGCGKSTVGNVLMRLLPYTDGKVLFKGKNIFAARGAETMEYRKKMQIIFQDPYSSINPNKTIQSILSEPYRIHKLARGKEMNEKIEQLAEMAGLEKYILDKYPHELDGGKRQLVGIARALSLSPEFIVCDEPVSSLDVSIQATIINLLMDLQKKLNLAFLFVSHDLSVVRHISNRVAVMYLGKIVELADTDTIFSNTFHPYSIALLSAVPKIDLDKKSQRIVLKGDVPSPMNPGEGCRFAPRCWMAQAICQTQSPELVQVEPNHSVACHFYQDSRKSAAGIIGKTQ
jgi:oligopeptide/dipeptide ABC transporter ATP-binding protein